MALVSNAARGSGSVTGSGALTQIFDATAVGGETSLDTGANGVLQTFNHLLVVVVSRHNVAEAINTGGLQFNGDTAGNYGWTRSRVNNSVAAALSNAAQSNTGGVASAGTSSANTFGTATLLIPNYRATAIKNVASLAGSFPSGGAAAAQELNIVAGGWNNTAAITRIAYAPPASLIAGSRLTIYGLL